MNSPASSRLLHSLPWYLFVGVTLIFVAACLAKPGSWRWADMVWLVVAAINLHLINTRIYGLKTARRWLLIILAGAFLAGVVNLFGGVLLGPVRFHKAFGSGLLGVPIGWLLLLVVVIFGARSLAAWMAPRITHSKLALLTGALAMVTMLNVLPLAVIYRNWWTILSQENAPGFTLPSWIVWLVIPAALTFFLREPSIQKPGPRYRSAVILLILNLCALLARVG